MCHWTRVECVEWVRLNIKLKTRECKRENTRFDRIRDTWCNSGEEIRVSERERELKCRINTQWSWTGRSGEPLNEAPNCKYSCHSVCLPHHLALNRVNLILIIEQSHRWDCLSSTGSWRALKRFLQLAGASVLLVRPGRSSKVWWRCRWRSCCRFKSRCTSDWGEAFFGLSTIRKVLDQSTRESNSAGSPERSSQKFLSHQGHN